MAKKILTLSIVHQHRRLLLAMKKRGFGAGRWNGFGGKVEEGETIEDAAKREAREEGGIDIREMAKVGVVDFEFKGDPKILEVHIFKIGSFAGDPVETEEMRPQWFHIDQIPYEMMWPDDRHWLPLFLAGKKFRGRFLFDEPGSATIIESKLGEVQEL